MLRGKLEENRESRAGEGYDMENLSKIPSQVNFWGKKKKRLHSDLARAFGNVVMPRCCFDLRWGRYKFPGASWSLYKAGKESSGNLRAVIRKKLHRLSFGHKNTKCDNFLPLLSPPYTHPSSLGRASAFSKTPAMVSENCDIITIYYYYCGNEELLGAYLLLSLVGCTPWGR